MGRNIHVVPHNDQWAVREEGRDQVSSTHRTQQEAIEQGREQARQNHSELVTHRPNGQIRDRDSYGNDPHPPQG